MEARATWTMFASSTSGRPTPAGPTSAERSQHHGVRAGSPFSRGSARTCSSSVTERQDWLCAAVSFPSRGLKSDAVIVPQQRRFADLGVLSRQDPPMGGAPVGYHRRRNGR